MFNIEQKVVRSRINTQEYKNPKKVVFVEALEFLV